MGFTAKKTDPNKSHVSLEQHRCMVCGVDYDTGVILLKKNLSPTLDRTTVTGMGLCPDHQALYDQGYIALVAVDPEKSGRPMANGNLDPEKAHRTGELAHLRREVFEQVFNVPATKGGRMLPMTFVDPDVIAFLKAKQEQAS